MNVSGLVCGGGAFVPAIRDRVRWQPPRGADWAGESIATVRDVDHGRMFFGAESTVVHPTPGPAYEVELDNGLRCWVPPEELFAIEGEAA